MFTGRIARVKTRSAMLNVPKRFFFLAMLVAFALPVLSARPAFAACSNPSGVEGEITYNTSEDVLQYCDNADWIGMGRKPALNEAVMPTDGLVGHWKLDESSGASTAADSSGNGNNGTLTNMDPATDWVAGEIDNALDFDGTNDYVTMGNILTSEITALPVSVSAWVYPRTTQGGIFTLDDFTSDSNGRQGFKVALYGGTKISGMYYPCSGSAGSCRCEKVQNTGTLQLNAWNHVAVVFTAYNNIKLYVNGIENSGTYYCSGTSNTINRGTFPARIGVITNYHGNTWRTNGVIDDVRVYNRDLTTDEIETLSGRDLNTSLIGHWKLDETSGTTAADSSSSGLNGTMQGGLSGTNDSVVGQLDGALDFNGTSDYIDIDQAFNGVGDFTFAAWFRADQAVPDTGDIVSERENASNVQQTQLILTRLNAGKADLRIRNSSGTLNSVTTTQSYDDGLWHHAVFQREGSTIRIYMNGGAEIVQTTGAVTGDVVDATNRLRIGAMVGSSKFFPGPIDDVRIYNRALSSSEVVSLYSLKIPGKITYNTDDNVMIFSDGQDWVPMGPNSPSEEINNFSGLVGWWKMNDGTGSGTVTDDSTNSNMATLTNMNASDDWVDGKYLDALDFDGSNDYLSIPDSAALEPANITLAAWIYLDAAPSSTNAIFQKPRSTPGSNGSCYSLFVSSTAEAAMYARSTATGTKTARSPDLLSSGRWYHMVGTADGSNIKIYVDGVLKATTAFPSSLECLGTSAGTDIGASNNGSMESFFNGKIDDARIYNRALSDAEVALLYQNAYCETPDGVPGEMVYNTTHNVMQYCNGEAWVGIGK